MKAIHLGIICVIVSLYSVVGYEDDTFRALRQQMRYSILFGRQIHYNLPYFPYYHEESPRKDVKNAGNVHHSTSHSEEPIRKNVPDVQNVPNVQNVPKIPEPEDSDIIQMPKVSKETKEISRAAELFSTSLFNAISNAPENAEVNYVVSPFSIWSLMILVAEGATDQSLDQLKNVLHLPASLNQLGSSYRGMQEHLFSNTSAVGLSLNQALFSDENNQIKTHFAEVLTNDYHANHLPVNFADRMNAAKSINNFIRHQTKGKIERIVNAEDLIDTHLLLSSSIFFNGEWKFKFNASHTKPQPFHSENGDLIGNVPMMTMQNPLRFAIFEGLNASFVELPYGHEDRLAMLLIFPLRNAKLSQVFQNLGRVDIAKIHREVYKYDDVGDVIVSLPRFKIDSDMELRSILETMGISDIFDRTKAKLSNMSKDPTFVSQVFHKAIIEVNEVGTVAAATSYANAVDFAYPLEFIFDKPFGFMITERTTHTLLFAGQVRNPLA